MKTLAKDNFTVYDFEPSCENFCQAVLAGLCTRPKFLPCKFFYDSEGSRLFDAICHLPEYYLTRLETKLLQEHIGAIERLVGKDVTLVEFGSGTSRKTKILLDNISTLKKYVPIDISKSQLLSSAFDLCQIYRRLTILPVCADYTDDLALPAIEAENTLVFFPGSTIGNFEPYQAISFLKKCAGLIGAQGGLLIGVDLKKDKQVLEDAYNDKKGLTAAFNLNLLARVSREFGIPPFAQRFQHEAVYNAKHGRVEMYLVSRLAHELCLNGKSIMFEKSETILTEYCYKFSLEEFAALAAQAGLYVDTLWTDEKNWFSIQYLRQRC